MNQQLAWSILGIFSLVAIIFSTLPIAGAFFFRPQKGNISKEASYECGLNPKSDPYVQHNVRYYLFALVFLIFSIEILYIYPWAINFKKLGSVALLEMAIFLLVLLMGLVYVWRKGGLDWQ